MDPITQTLTGIGTVIGLSPAAIAFTIPMIVLGCRAVTRAIPDTATGWLGYVRIATKWVGLHVKDNTGLPAIQTSATTAIKQEVTAEIPEMAEETLKEAEPNLFTAAATLMNQDK